MTLEDIKKALKPKPQASIGEQFASVDYTIPSVPLIIEKRNDDWVSYGENNLYPLMVNDLRAGSGIHNSIVKTKAKMTAGDGLLINGAKTEEESDSVYGSLDPRTKAEYDAFTKGTYDLFYKCADDLQEQGQFCFEVMWNADFTRVVSKKYVDVKNIRAGKMFKDKVQSYWYSRDWSQARRAENKPREIQAFSRDNKKSLNQLVFEKLGNQEYYGELPYKGGLNWIQIDMKMALYHLSNIDNGMNPGLHFKFFKKPKSDYEKQMIIDELKLAYKGSLKVGAPMFTFSDGKDEAVEIAPIETSNLDKQLIHMAELCDRKILTAHQLTTPMLAGLTTSGQLGGANELEIGYRIFDKMTIKSDRNFLIAPFNEILEINKVPLTLEINPYVLDFQSSTAKPVL